MENDKKKPSTNTAANFTEKDEQLSHINIDTTAKNSNDDHQLDETKSHLTPNTTTDLKNDEQIPIPKDSNTENNSLETQLSSLKINTTATNSKNGNEQEKNHSSEDEHTSTICTTTSSASDDEQHYGDISSLNSANNSSEDHRNIKKNKQLVKQISTTDNASTFSKAVVVNSRDQHTSHTKRKTTSKNYTRTRKHNTQELESNSSTPSSHQSDDRKPDEHLSQLTQSSSSNNSTDEDQIYINISPSANKEPSSKTAAGVSKNPDGERSFLDDYRLRYSPVVQFIALSNGVMVTQDVDLTPAVCALLDKCQQPLSQSLLANSTPWERKQILGNHLNPMIQYIYPGYIAGNITSLLLQQSTSVLYQMLTDITFLKSKVADTVKILNGQELKVQRNANTNMSVPTNQPGTTHTVTQRNYIRAREPIRQAILDNVPPSEHRQVLGEHLFAKIKNMYPPLAGKITGMLLEFDNSTIINFIEDDSFLTSKVNESVVLLLAHWDKAETAGRPDPLAVHSKGLIECIWKYYSACEWRQIIGELLYYKIAQMHPNLTGKITGMFLDLQPSELIQMYDSSTYLRCRVHEAVELLRRQPPQDTEIEQLI